MPQYKITSVAKLADIKQDGTFIYFYRVHFEYKGIQDFIDVPEDQYTEQTVKKLIEERIKTHMALIG